MHTYIQNTNNNNKALPEGLDLILLPGKWKRTKFRIGYRTFRITSSLTNCKKTRQAWRSIDLGIDSAMAKDTTTNISTRIPRSHPDLQSLITPIIWRKNSNWKIQAREGRSW
jgi:hypothetical protein